MPARYSAAACSPSMIAKLVWSWSLVIGIDQLPWMVPLWRRRMPAPDGTDFDLPEMKVNLWQLQAKLESEASIQPRT